MEPLPYDVANAMVHEGGIAFCAPGIPYSSFLLFLDLQAFGEYTADQQRARAEAWKGIETFASLRSRETHK